jgi:hypothetical protein
MLIPEGGEQMLPPEEEVRIRILERIRGPEWAKRERERVAKELREREEKDRIAMKHFKLPYRELEPWQQSMVDLIILRDRGELRRFLKEGP